MLDRLQEALDVLAAADPATLADPDAIIALHRNLAQMEAVTTRAVAAFDAAREYLPDRAQTAAQWIAHVCGLPRSAARRRVSLGRHLRHLPAFEAAWLDGAVTAAHVATVAAIRRDDTAELLARDEHLLAGNARTMRFEAFARTVAYWDQLADPDGADDRDRNREARRDVYLAESYAGMWLGKMTFDPISGTIFSTEMRRLERELFEADWAAARLRLGHEPGLWDLDRTSGQRRADALVEMATRSRTAPPGGKRPAPLFSVLVGYETFAGRICELAAGTVIAPGTLLPWLDHAYIERAVFGLDQRVDVSATARLFTGKTRRAIELRDRYCTEPYCDQPAEACQADHIVAYTDGGPTTQHNGQLQCGYHNRLKHQRPPPPD
jgi:hypothetical protein